MHNKNLEKYGNVSGLKYSPRPYQEEMFYFAIDAVLRNEKLMLQLETGGGKTFIFTWIVKWFIENSDKNVIILAHRKELIEQALKSIFKMAEIDPAIVGVIQGKNKISISKRIQVGSIQTYVNRGALPNIGLMIIDECHHATASSYLKIIEKHPEAVLLGFTATPYRRDGKGFKEIFNSLYCGPPTKWLMEQGYLCKNYEAYISLGIDLGKIKKIRGEYSEKEQYEYLKSYTGDFVKSWKMRADNGQTISFAVNVEHSMAIAEKYREEGIPAACVHGKMKDHEREKILRDFSKRQIKVLTNCDIVTEGFDVPEATVCQLCSGTTSTSKDRQRRGRVLRADPNNPNKVAIIMDHANNLAIHGMPDDVIIWSLEGEPLNTENEGTKIKFVKKDKDGKEEFIKQSEISAYSSGFNISHTVKMIRVDDIEYKEFKDIFLEKLRIVKSRGNKPLKAYYDTLEYVINEKNMILNDEMIAYAQVKCGAKNGWLHHERLRLSEEFSSYEVWGYD